MSLAAGCAQGWGLAESWGHSGNAQEAALKGTRGVCAIPAGSLQAALGLGLKDWEGNLWSGSLEPA